MVNVAAFVAALRGDLKNAVIADTKGGIEAQEKQGQRMLVNSSMLPIYMHNVTREQLTKLGFRFGNEVDDLFVECALPDGWTKKATEHSMHSTLVDEQGRDRANIFYKAAFYDRRADLRMFSRFKVDIYHEERDSATTTNYVTVKDQKTVVFRQGPLASDDYEKRDELRKICIKWLADRYPEWENPLAYW
jgi:hypothetical protein